MIVCRDLSYRYPAAVEPVLQNLNFTVAAGELALLAGASGSGKSTLCRLFNGLIPHLHGGEVSGALTVAGHDPRATPTHQMSDAVGLLLQRPDAQCLATTVARDIAFGPAARGLDRSAIVRRVREAAEWLDIAHLLGRAPHTLSGGEQQRVALAGVLAMRPPSLVLDEPFAFLDAAGAAQLREILRRLRQTGVALIVAEHRIDQVADIADRMMVLDRGRLMADGPPDLILSGDVAAWGLEAPDGPPPAPPQPPVETAEPVVEWEAVRFERDRRPVLLGIDLKIATGETVALLGANGAGKSTLLRHGNGLLRPQRGTVRVLGHAIGRRPVAELARTVGLVMQHPARMLFAPTVRAELAAGPQALRRHDPAWCARLGERFGLTDLLDRPPQLLSAGEQRRVALAAVLAGRPKALLLDEPTAGQDARARAILRDLLAECAGEGLAILVATHNLVWARTFCPRWAVLCEGHIAADGAPAEVLARPELLCRARLAVPVDRA